MKYIQTLVALALLTYSILVFSDQSKIIEDSNNRLLVQITSSYVLGDGDTRIDGKNIALQNAKRAAAEMAGSYIEAQKHIIDDQIKSDSIKVISTALLSTKVLKESVSLTADARTRVELLVEADLDKKSLMAKLGTLKNNSEKKDQILQLKKDNESLRSELLALNKQIASLKTEKKNEMVKKPRPELTERRDQVLSKIEVNEASIRKVFAKGTLFSLAKKSSRDFENAKEDIESNIWQYIVSNTDIRLDDPEFQDNGNGTFDVVVFVSWEINGQPIINALNKYFLSGYNNGKFKFKNVDFSDHMGTSVPGVKIKKYSNQKENQLLPYTFKLYEYLLTKRIMIEVSAGQYKSGLTIATSRQCHVSCRDSQGDSQYQIHFNNKIHPKEIIFSYSEQNPVVIKSVPAKVLENLTNIDAKVVVK